MTRVKGPYSQRGILSLVKNLLNAVLAVVGNRLPQIQLFRTTHLLLLMSLPVGISRLGFTELG